MIRLTIQSYGETIVDRQLLRFADDLENPTTALENVATVMREAVQEQFDTEGAHASGGWPPLKAATLERKERLGLRPEILRATDALMNSLTNKFDPKHIERLSGSSLTFGSLVPYGIYHQSSAARTKIPFRPPVALTPADKHRMVKEVQSALVASLREAHPPMWGQ